MQSKNVATPTPAVTTTGPMGSPEGVTPSVGIPHDLIAQAMRRLNETQGSLPTTASDIIRDAVIHAYQRGANENQAESDLINDAVESVNTAHQSRTIDLVISSVMYSLDLTELDINMAVLANGISNHDLHGKVDYDNGVISYTLTPKEVIEP